MSDYSIDLNELEPPPNDEKLVIKNCLGDGSGTVYAAKYQGTAVAVKMIRACRLLDSEESIIKECNRMFQLHHPALCRLYGYQMKKECTYIVMELGERNNLADVLKDKSKYPKIDWKTRLTIALEISKGIAYLHKYRILHRDLKSSNIIIRNDWSAFITDYGFARIKLLTSDSLGLNGVGSYQWMAPELHQEKNPTSPSIDIFSFGMILYELLTRYLPFELDQMSYSETIHAVSRGRRPFIPSRTENLKYPSMKDCPRGYLELMKECWHKDPCKRPTAKNVALRLDSMIKSLPLDSSQQDAPSPTSEKLGLLGWIFGRRKSTPTPSSPASPSSPTLTSSSSPSLTSSSSPSLTSSSSPSLTSSSSPSLTSSSSPSLTSSSSPTLTSSSSPGLPFSLSAATSAELLALPPPVLSLQTGNKQEKFKYTKISI